MTETKRTVVDIRCLDSETQALNVALISPLGEQQELTDAAAFKTRGKELNGTTGLLLAKAHQQESRLVSIPKSRTKTNGS